MKIVITISDAEEERLPYAGDPESEVTAATVASDDLLGHLETLAIPYEEA